MNSKIGFLLVYYVLDNKFPYLHLKSFNEKEVNKEFKRLRRLSKKRLKKDLELNDNEVNTITFDIIKYKKVKEDFNNINKDAE